MPGFSARATQGGAVVPQRPAQVRCDPQGTPSLRDAEPRSQGVSGGEEVLRVPWGGGGKNVEKADSRGWGVDGCLFCFFSQFNTCTTLSVFKRLILGA